MPTDSAPPPAATSAVRLGYLEGLSSAFVNGWAAYTDGAPSHVYALLGTEILGSSVADQIRADLTHQAKQTGLQAGGFFILFNRPVTLEEQQRVTVRAINAEQQLARLPELKVDRGPAYPLFVVGSPRSGTSILVQALLTAGYTGYYEGNFLSLLHRLDIDVETHFKVFGATDSKVLTAHIDKDELKSRLSSVLRDTVETLYKGQPWLDKTGNPEMISAIPIIRAIWPNSVFIFAKRRAIENVTSRLKKFPKFEFKYHCIDWARNMATWRDIRATQRDLKFLEIDQWDIANEPKALAEVMVAFLNLPEEKTKIIADTFIHKRPQETDAGTSSRTLTLVQTGWTTTQQEIFRQHCGQEMSANGYTEDETYRSVPFSDGLRFM